jgi:hypothetical protein
LLDNDEFRWPPSFVDGRQRQINYNEASTPIDKGLFFTLPLSLAVQANHLAGMSDDPSPLPIRFDFTDATFVNATQRFCHTQLLQ